VATNVEQLLSQLNQKPKLDELEKNLAGKILGDYREKIVAAYSKLVLAELTIGDIESLGNSGALSKRLVEERRSTREVAAAQFAAACETSRFSALQARDKARAAAEQAQRMLAIADEAVAKLLGPLADTTPVGDDGKLSELVLLAPLAGRIEERHAVEAARVAIGSPLFVVADTSTLWVSAEIHERDWPALSAAQLGPIEVRSPALIDSVLEAQLRFVGAEVDSATRSVPLVAQLDNSAGRLKPGMFVWVEVPLESPRQALVVSPAAIMRHENQPFVFVPSGQDAFRRVDVRLGLETRSAAEILAGLKEGDRVVDQGAFYLKSELLLESEE
jgi:cobalt-zinc-cadmium efflux system membrane fusion protein